MCNKYTINNVKMKHPIVKMFKTVNISITSKYKHIIQDVRDDMRDGQSLEIAVKKAVETHEFDSEEDKIIIMNWFNGKFAA